MAQTQESRPHIDEATHLFRRQFLLGPAEFLPNSNWKSRLLASGLHLSHHVDLPVALSTREHGVLVLVGMAVDAFRPQATPEEMLGKLDLPMDISSSYLNDATENWTGRWCFFCINESQRVAITDPCGLRSIHYHNANGAIWVGSQPEIIRTQVTLTPDQEVCDYYASLTASGREPSLIGSRTEYNNCFTLLPNHRLELSSGRANRFFPIEALAKVDPNEAKRIAVRCLKGGLEGILNYGRVSIPFTAGYDSRVLFAASKQFQSQYDYFVDRKEQLTLDDPDVVIPQTICKQLGVPFSIESSRQAPDAEFMKMLVHNVTGGRNIPKTKMIYRKFLEQDQRININGNGSEVCRFYFDPYRRRIHQRFSGASLAHAMKCTDQSLDLLQLDDWLVGAQEPMRLGYLCLDLAYWEHRMGRWGALYPAEQDITIDEYSPFNNRLLITTLLGVPGHLRCEPKYRIYREIMKELWPEVLSQPFNPKPFKKAIRDWAYKRLPDPVQNSLVFLKKILLRLLRR